MLSHWQGQCSASDSINKYSWYAPTGHDHQTEPYKNDNSRKGWHFRFNNDYKIFFKYILSITKTWISELNTYNTIYCKLDKKGNWENKLRLRVKEFFHPAPQQGTLGDSIIWWPASLWLQCTMAEATVQMTVLQSSQSNPQRNKNNGNFMLLSVGWICQVHLG